MIRCPCCGNPMITGMDDYERAIYYCACCDHKLQKKVVDSYAHRINRICYRLDGEAIV